MFSRQPLCIFINPPTYFIPQLILSPNLFFGRAYLDFPAEDPVPDFENACDGSSSCVGEVANDVQNVIFHIFRVEESPKIKFAIPAQSQQEAATLVKF